MWLTRAGRKVYRKHERGGVTPSRRGTNVQRTGGRVCARVRQDPEDGVPVVRYRSGWTCSLPILRVPGPRQGDHYRQPTGPYRPSMPQMRSLVRRSGGGMPPVRLPGGTSGECRCSRVRHICAVSVPEMQSRVHAQDTRKHRWPRALTANRTPPAVRSHHGSCAGIYNSAVKREGTSYVPIVQLLM